MHLVPVDSFAPNPFGLYNMHGNVMEWCSDWLSTEYYASSPSEDPQGPKTGDGKVARGGGYSNPPFSATSYWRMARSPSMRLISTGVRPVIELPRN